MTRYEAQRLAQTVSLDDLKHMFVNAFTQIRPCEWKDACRINPSMSKGTAFNLLSRDLGKYADAHQIHPMNRRNKIWAFGEYLPGYKPKEKKPKIEFTPAHENPVLPPELINFL